MEVIKIVLFIYATVSPVFPSEFARRMYYEPILTNDKSCLCYPRNQIYATVPEILNPQNNGLERLVLYVYKDVKTNEIKMYTPNSRKQHLIPDLPFELGDGLITLSDEVTIDIFNTNPNRIVLNDVRHRIRDEINSNTNVFNKITSKINSNRIVHDKTRDDMIVMPIGMEIGNVEEINDDSFVRIPNSNVIAEVIEAIPQEDFTFNAIRHSNNKWSAMSSGDTRVKMRPLARPWHRDVQNEQWHGNVPKSYLYPEKHWDINSVMTQGLHNVVEINTKGKTQHNYMNTKVFTPNVQNVIPFVGKKHYLSFDDWFIQQMRSFKNVNLPGDIDSINTIAFKTLIEKTLKENNMHVTIDGVLTDSQGIALDASNLELRPMLLGNPVESQKVLNGGSGDMKLPKDLPYLEGILVTLVYPPKVLGIIPLGKTTLSQVSSSRNKETSVKITAVPTVSVADPRSVVEKDQLPKLAADSPAKGHKVAFGANKLLQRPVIRHEYVSQGKKGKHVKKTNANLKAIPTDLKAEANVEPGHQSRRLIADNILNKLYDMLSFSRRGYLDYESDEDYEPYFEELPDFRIIGGNPATSSGAPVNNKGRSGNVIIDN